MSAFVVALCVPATLEAASRLDSRKILDPLRRWENAKSGLRDQRLLFPRYIQNHRTITTCKMRLG